MPIVFGEIGMQAIKVLILDQMGGGGIFFRDVLLAHAEEQKRSFDVKIIVDFLKQIFVGQQKLGHGKYFMSGAYYFYSKFFKREF